MEMEWNGMGLGTTGWETTTYSQSNMDSCSNTDGGDDIMGFICGTFGGGAWDSRMWEDTDRVVLLCCASKGRTSGPWESTDKRTGEEPTESPVGGGLPIDPNAEEQSQQPKAKERTTASAASLLSAVSRYFGRHQEQQSSKIFLGELEPHLLRDTDLLFDTHAFEIMGTGLLFLPSLI